jgi:hypothetical protein
MKVKELISALQQHPSHLEVVVHNYGAYLEWHTNSVTSELDENGEEKASTECVFLICD